VGRSLMMKMAMLAATAAVVVWVGWPPEEERAGHVSASAVQESPASTRFPDADAPTAAKRGMPETAETSAKAAPGTVDGRLDINRATVEQFEQLPGIGLVLARRIVEQREARGPFRSIEDLRNVKGIGERRMERLRPLLIASSVHSRSTGAKSQKPVPAEKERRAQGMNGL